MASEKLVSWAKSERPPAGHGHCSISPAEFVGAALMPLTIEDIGFPGAPIRITYHSLFPKSHPKCLVPRNWTHFLLILGGFWDHLDPELGAGAATNLGDRWA